MFFLTALITSSFNVANKVGFITCIGLGFAISILLLLSMVTKVLLYDTLVYWVIIQSVANVVVIALHIIELINANGKDKFVYIGAFLPLISFGVDLVATYLGAWEGGIISNQLVTQPYSTLHHTTPHHTTLYIESATSPRSEEYQQLTKDFYL